MCGHFNIAFHRDGTRLEPTCGNLSQRPTPNRVVSSLAFFAAPLCEACDYCQLGQGLSSLRTQTGAGVRVSRRYTSLDSVNAADTEVSNPGVKEKYWTTDVAGFYSLNDRLLVLVNVPLRKTERDGEPIDPREAPDRGRRAVDGHRAARADDSPSNAAAKTRQTPVEDRG